MRDKLFQLPTELVRSFSLQLKQLLPDTEELAVLAPDGAVCWASFDAASLGGSIGERTRAIMASGIRQAEIVDPSSALTVIPALNGDEVVAAVLVAIRQRSTHRRSGFGGSTSSASSAALSVMDGRPPRA